MEITPSIRDYVLSKLERINRHFEQVIDVKVIMSVQKLDRKIEATVHLSGKDIHVACHDADMYAAIDGLVDKISAMRWCSRSSRPPSCRAVNPGS